MNLIVDYFATLRVHARHLMVMASGFHAENRISFSVIFDSFSNNRTLLSFFLFFETEATKHKPCCILAVHDITESVR